MADHERSHLYARPVRSVNESCDDPQLIWLREMPKSTQNVAGILERMGDETAEHLPEWMQSVLEPGRNPEIAAPST